MLAELGYLYDSSLLPTFYAPLLRLLQRLLSGGARGSDTLRPGGQWPGAVEALAGGS